MRPEEEAKWKEFQSLMAFIDHLTHGHIVPCRVVSENERRRNKEVSNPFYMYEPLTFDAVEKMVRRYLGLPSKEHILKLVDADLARIRQRHEEERIAKELPGIVH